jgi:hypothetical protein
MYEARTKRRRILVPNNPRTIKLHSQQYDLAKKWVEYQAKLADLRTKLNDGAEDHSSKIVRNMAKHALAGQSVGVYGLKGDNA